MHSNYLASVRALSAFQLFVTLAMLFSELPIEYCAVLGLLIVWNVAVSYDNISPPSRLVANVLALVSCAVLFALLGFREMVNLSVAMLMLATSLKLLISKTVREFKVVSLVGLFLAVTILLFKQNILATFTAFAVVVMSLINLFLITTKLPIRKALNYSVRACLFTVPITLVFFVLIPKIPSFWQMPTPGTAEIGLSDKVDPFNIANLTKSAKRVFRAEFKTTPQLPLYWRAMVHTEFTGRTWELGDSAENQINLTIPDHIETRQAYTIYMEKSDLPWLVGLGFSTTNFSDAVTTQGGTLLLKTTKAHTFNYDAISLPLNLVTHELNAFERLINLQLPPNLNPESLKLAKQLRQSYPDDTALVNALMRYFADKGFIYTLKPPVYPSNSAIDNFMFGAKQGFCGHYASASAFILRAAGIPARVASGYLGGEFSEDQSYLTVYNYDAHAWTEVWINNRWIRFDATEVVEPDRLYGSLSQLEQMNQDFYRNLNFSLSSLSKFAAFNQLRMWLEDVDYRWTAWVLGFDRKDQENVLKDLLGDNDIIRVVIALVVLVGAMLGALYLYQVFKARPKYSDEVAYAFSRVLKIANYHQLPQRAGETPTEFINRLCTELDFIKSDLLGFLSLYNKVRYQALELTKEEQKQLKHYLANIKYKRKK